MKPRVSLRNALDEPDLLGGILGDDSWYAWRVLLLAAMGEELLPTELEVFRRLTGRDAPPSRRVDELWCCVGRRGGKSRAMATLAIYLAALCEHEDLKPGEKGVVLLIAPDVRQAKVALDYAEGVLQSNDSMWQLFASRTAETLTLTNGITLEVRSASFRRIRGMTCVAVLADECAFWLSEASSNPDSEILAAARPALATTHGPLIAISSPYARRGELWETYRRHYGAEGDPLILVARGTSREFNPTLDQGVIDRAMERDAAAARAEYLAEFRTDIENFISHEAVMACVEPAMRELRPAHTHDYVAFVDPSGGSSDSMTLAISHKEGKTAILDCVREAKAPFSPEAVVEEFSDLLKSYRLTRVFGDRYAGEWPREQFRKKGINYAISEKAKSELYGDLLPLINSRAISLLEHDRLIRQLVGLERRTARGGRDSIDHAPGCHDDIANAVAGAIGLAWKKSGSAGQWGPSGVSQTMAIVGHPDKKRHMFAGRGFTPGTKEIIRHLSAPERDVISKEFELARLGRVVIASAEPLQGVSALPQKRACGERARRVR